RNWGRSAGCRGRPTHSRCSLCRPSRPSAGAGVPHRKSPNGNYWAGTPRCDALTSLSPPVVSPRRKHVIASAAKQSGADCGSLRRDCFAALAMTTNRLFPLGSGLVRIRGDLHFDDLVRIGDAAVTVGLTFLDLVDELHPGD